ncbi:MAG: hypothetical protein QOJ09_2666 [Actinomycetota bacterium]|nr:hypothetical protein [Actinomycetota bacterium]
MVIASIHFADVGAAQAVRMLRTPRRADGLRHAAAGLAVPLATSPLPAVFRGRVGLVAFWTDDEALDRFLAGHRYAARLLDGWHARLEPLRAYGTWPGLPDDTERDRTTGYEGPAIVLTLGRLRLTQTRRFLRTSALAETAALDAPGLIWATAMARPPFVATCSLWESSRALSDYAYGRTRPAHPDAIVANEARAFHRRSAFIRFRPYRVAGSLGGTNPLPTSAMAAQLP